ncbi:DUF421 domain-containing protein [Jiangella aurantiaca]|uniref:DUF421 domain-containing protein n=2 Tax=Jiangella aurantiaca TaxID=2530373 RepID=A0A4R5AKT1_9ACTN|nr:DUF421 domain-containing protein [Jiangella aurantiaca]
MVAGRSPPSRWSCSSTFGADRISASVGRMLRRYSGAPPAASARSPVERGGDPAPGDAADQPGRRRVAPRPEPAPGGHRRAVCARGGGARRPARAAGGDDRGVRWRLRADRPARADHAPEHPHSAGDQCPARRRIRWTGHPVDRQGPAGPGRFQRLVPQPRRRDVRARPPGVRVQPARRRGPAHHARRTDGAGAAAQLRAVHRRRRRPGRRDGRGGLPDDGAALMDIVVRAAVVFVILWLVLRMSGKRQVTQLSAFDLILLVTLGDLISQTVLQEDLSLTGGTLAVATFALLSVLLSWLSWRFKRPRKLFQGEPTVIIKDGKVDDEVLRYERLPIDDVLEAAREHGIRDLGDVDLMVLEPDGTFSVFARSNSRGSEEPPKRGAEAM